MSMPTAVQEPPSTPTGLPAPVHTQDLEPLTPQKLFLPIFDPEAERIDDELYGLHHRFIEDPTEDNYRAFESAVNFYKSLGWKLERYGYDRSLEHCRTMLRDSEAALV